MQEAIGLITGGAEGAGDAQDPSRTKLLVNAICLRNWQPVQ
jgi:hypothetical protein